jgi:hypothetical protein
MTPLEDLKWARSLRKGTRNTGELVGSTYIRLMILFLLWCNGRPWGVFLRVVTWSDLHFKYSHASINDGDTFRKCVVRWFHHCINIIESTCTNLDGTASYTQATWYISSIYLSIYLSHYHWQKHCCVVHSVVTWTGSKEEIGGAKSRSVKPVRIYLYWSRRDRNLDSHAGYRQGDNWMGLRVIYSSKLWG